MRSDDQADIQWLTGDALDAVRGLPDRSVDLVATSPPFLALRDYGGGLPGQWGHEPNPAAYLDHLLTLTIELRRVLTPHGSIAIELGDTFSGSGGPGGDYNPIGKRAGQPDTGPSPADLARSTGGWPLPKSLTGIPTLSTWSLAYGRNLLGGGVELQPWRIRNVIVWARNNPSVGLLHDKVRPATSYITVACTSTNRWFDLDAVRGPLQPGRSRWRNATDSDQARHQCEVTESGKWAEIHGRDSIGIDLDPTNLGRLTARRREVRRILTSENPQTEIAGQMTLEGLL
jgi:hypothetical protein